MRLTLTVGLLVSLTAVPALAEAAPRRYYRHESVEREYYGHEGLFMRLSLGAGGVAADDELNDLTLSSGSGLFSVDLGGSLAPDLALHGRLAVTSMFEPTLTSGGGDDLGDLDNTSLTFTLIGGGLTFYLPSNVFLTGVVGFSRASFEFDGDEYDALNGLGFMGDVGYEWQIARDWGIGVAGRIELHSVRGDGEKLSTAGLGVLVNLTYF